MDYTKDFDAITKGFESKQLALHRLLNKMAQDWRKSGDVRPVLSGINHFLTSGPKGIRMNAVKAWVEKHFGFVYNTETDQFVAGKLKAAKLDLDTIKNRRWWEETAEPKFIPVADAHKAVLDLVKRFEKDRTKLGDASNVSLELIAKLKQTVPAPAKAA